MTTAVLLLAGGLSRRFGAEDKLLAPFAGRPLVAHAAQAVREVAADHRIAVADLAHMAFLDGFERIAPPRPAAQSASLHAGVERAAELGAARLLVVLGDMPLIDAAVLAAVLDRAGVSRIAAVTDGTRRMPPACFPAQAFRELLGLGGDRGAGALLAGLDASALVRVPAECLRDVDLPEDIDPGA